MRSPTCLKLSLVLASVVAAGAPSPAPGQDREQAKPSPRLSVAEFDKLHQMLKPQPGESRWMEIDWHPSVWEARRKAAAEGKPIFIWAGSGGAPAAGC
jgi:hypothetical protein